jgi:hypothetical protein
VAARRLGRRHLRIVLEARGRFAAGGYRGARDGTLTLEAQLVRVVQRTGTATAPPSDLGAANPIQVGLP